MDKLDKFIKQFYNHFADIREPVSADMVLQKISIDITPAMADQFLKIIEDTGDFVIDSNNVIPKAYFLENIPFRIRLTPFELEHNILIPGHRIIPFCLIDMALDEVSILYKDRKINTRKEKFLFKDIETYYSFCNAGKIPISPISEEALTEKSLFLHTVYDMEAIFKKNKAKQGDSLICYAKDLNSGIFIIEFDSAENQDKNRREIDNANIILYDALEDVIQKKIFTDVNKQLLKAYYNIGNKYPAIAPDTISKILFEKKKITFSRILHGNVVFHFVNEEPEFYPDLEKIHDQFQDEYDFESIDGVLRFLGSNHNETIVTALILEQLPSKAFSFESIEDYIFHKLELPHYPDDEFEELFFELVEELYDDCMEDFGTKPPSLEIQAMRKKILSYNQDITQFLRGLDENQIHPENLPKDEMYQLMEISQTFDSMLLNLEDNQIDNENDDIKRMKVFINTLDEDLKDIYNVINRRIQQLIKGGKVKKRKKKSDFKNVLQLKITLKGIRPPIWRRVIIPDNYTFSELNLVIQSAMGWGNYHLHEFFVKRDSSGNRDLHIGIPGDDDMDMYEVLNEKNTGVMEYLNQSVKSIDYLYDFGDYWEHTIKLEKILLREKNITYPICIKGKRACPPEDCGGIPGYDNFLNIISSPDDPEYESMMDWIGVEFDPEYFDIEDIF